MAEKKFAKIRRMARPLAKSAMGIYLYGSYAKGREHAKSDIDLCVVAAKNRDALYRETNVLMAKHPVLDIKLFEELPLYMKKSVMEEGMLLFAKDEVELSGYLRFYRKLWNIQAAVRLGYQKAIA